MTADRRLGAATEQLIAQSEVAVSTASLWEMVLKSERGKLPLPAGGLDSSIEGQGFVLLSISPVHVETSRQLELVHPDPFDRLLVATARVEDRVLLTRDSAILKACQQHPALPVRAA